MPTDLPNLLTLSRIAVLPALVVLMALHTPLADTCATAVFALAGLTDWLDGAVARSRGLTSDFGRMLDPIADKLMVGATLLMLAGTGRFAWGGLYAALLILLREIFVSGLREYLAGAHVALPVTRLAKWKTGVQMAALGALVAGDGTAGLLGLGGLPLDAIGAALLWLAAALTLLTGWDYLTTGLRHVGAHVGAARR